MPPSLIPLAAHRPAPLSPQARSQQRSPERQQVEALLLKTPRDKALTPDAIAKRTKLPLSIVRSLITNICNSGLAHSVVPGARPARYAGGQPPLEFSQPVDHYVPKGHYHGTGPQPVRADSLRFLDLPSVENGEWVPRARPLCLGGSQDARK